MINSFFDLLQRREYEYRWQTPTEPGCVITELQGNMKESRVLKKYDVEQIIKSCEQMRKMNESSNGFSDLKHFRHIGRMPAFARFEIEDLAQGDTKEEWRLVKKWYQEHPEFCTVDPKSF